MPLSSNSLCANCQIKPPAYNRCIAAFSYQPPIDKIIVRLKSDPYAAEIKQLCALLAQRIFLSYPHTAPPQLVIPLPLHWRKMTQRGFNQSQIISSLLANYFSQQKTSTTTLIDPEIKIRNDLCYRISNSQPQHTLDKKQRAKTVRKGFATTPQAASILRGLSVAVVDDVVTTGATANAIAAALRNAGANTVDIWCLARTSWNNSPQ